MRRAGRSSPRYRFVIAALAAFAVVMSAMAANRPLPEYLKSAVVYQVVLRNITAEGTFSAAEKKLEHIRAAADGAALLSEDGALSEDGECRLGPWGYVVQPLCHRQLP